MTAASSDALSRVRDLLDLEFSKRGLIAVPTTDETRVTYLQPPVEWIAFTVSFGTDDAGSRVEGESGVDPLVRPEAVVLSFPIEIDGARRIRRSGWSLEELESRSLEAVQSVTSQLDELRSQYESPQLFASKVDDDYLYDDSPDLAEAVAYLWLLSGATEKAILRLTDLIADRDMIQPDIFERCQSMLTLVRSDQAAAIRRLEAWRRSRLETLGLDPDPS